MPWHSQPWRSPSAAAAQAYPNRPVTFIVPYGAGGPVDVLARALSEPMRAALGQPIVIENIVGANGTIGVGRAVHAAPDGYTVSIGNWPSHITNGAIYNLNYDIQKDLVPVARLPQNPYIAVVRKDFPAKDFKEFIAWLKANPDKATEGTAGLGSGQHISGVYFQKITGMKFQFVPYKSGSVRHHPRHHRRPHRLHLRSGHHLAVAYQGRQRQGAGGDVRQAARCRARHPDRGRGRRAGHLYLDMVRAVGAEGHAAGGDRQARRSGARGDGRSGARASG